MMQNDLTKGPIGKGILVFLLPLLASTLIQQLYNTVDLILLVNSVEQKQQQP